jgi:hypothetical protein
VLLHRHWAFFFCHARTTKANFKRVSLLVGMPRYFFSARGPVANAKEAEGEELPDDVAAHRRALIAADQLTGGIFEDGTLVVCDARGRLVVEVPVGRKLN